ncbi:MAG: nitroreductase family protein [Candidatus Thorarchaeota archaeon]|jgi:nitroreductase
MSNPVIETINSRRSTRAYEPTPIPRDIINTIIEAGNLAPSRGRMEEGEILFQPWRFVVVENPEFKQRLVHTTNPIWKQSVERIKGIKPETYETAMNLYNAMDEPKDMVYYCAPVILFVIGLADYSVSCALACENIMLAAHSLGLGSCYVGFGSMVKGDADIVKALELTDDERIFGPIVLGYPKDIPEQQAMQSEKKAPVIKWI